MVTAGDIAGAFATIGKVVLKLVNWGITIIVILLIIEIIRLFYRVTGKTAGKAAARLTDWDKNPVLNALGWTKKAKRRENTKLLNEYIQEQKTTNMLQEAEKVAQEALLQIKDFVKHRGISTATERDKFLEKIEQLGNHLTDVRREYRRVNRATWRQEREMDKILKRLKETEQDVSQITTLENDILKLHKEAVEELDTVLDIFNGFKKPLQFLAKLKTPATLDEGSSFPVDLTKLLKSLDAVYKKQEAIDKEVEGLIALVQRLWASE